jgi:hypothetical protein
MANVDNATRNMSNSQPASLRSSNVRIRPCWSFASAAWRKIGAARELTVYDEVSFICQFCQL